MTKKNNQTRSADHRTAKDHIADALVRMSIPRAERERLGISTPVSWAVLGTLVKNGAVEIELKAAE